MLKVQQELRVRRDYKEQAEQLVHREHKALQVFKVRRVLVDLRVPKVVKGQRD